MVRSEQQRGVTLPVGRVGNRAGAKEEREHLSVPVLGREAERRAARASVAVGVGVRLEQQRSHVAALDGAGHLKYKV